MRTKFLRLLALVLLLGSTWRPIPAQAAQELKPLFDGQTLKGWRARGDAKFDILDGAIRGSTGGGGFGWLCTEKTYGDFVLELELKIIAGNSGVQIRSHLPDGKTMVGYQIEGDPSRRAWSGGLYEQGRRGWLQNLTNLPAARAAFKTNEWNRYRIVCEGAAIRSWVNDVPATDYLDAMDLDGLIALQVHSGKGVEVWFRNLRLADNGRHRWQPLWDGKTLNGWHTIGKGDWQITDGAICASHAASEAEFGHLVTDSAFGDFTARLKYKSVRGNSGFYFRILEQGFSGVSGFQAEIDPTKDAGGLYETNGRSWVSQPTPDAVKKWYRPDAWNTMTVHAYGRRVAVDVNGFRTAELMDDPGRLEGRFALQVHGGQDCNVCFKDLEILEKVK
jgi:hypothetical protein